MSAPVTTTMPSLYYVQDSRSICGNCASWWRLNGEGYTCDLRYAWRVRGDERTWRETDLLRPCSEVDALAVMHVDVQGLG